MRNWLKMLSSNYSYTCEKKEGTFKLLVMSNLIL